MVRYQHDIIALKSRVIGWAVPRVRLHTRAHVAVIMTLQYLDNAAELAGGRRTHFLRCARDQWRVAVRLLGG